MHFLIELQKDVDRWLDWNHKLPTGTAYQDGIKFGGQEELQRMRRRISATLDYEIERRAVAAKIQEGLSK